MNEASFALDKDDPNIPILIRDGWTLQPDGKWVSLDKRAEFLREKDGLGRRVLTTAAPPKKTKLRFSLD